MEFKRNQYMVGRDRAQLASNLDLTETQVNSINLTKQVLDTNKSNSFINCQNLLNWSGKNSLKKLMFYQ